MPRKAPVDTALRKQIEQNRAMLHTLMGQLDKFEACGVNCEQYRKVGQYLHDELGKVLRFVFDGQTPTAEEVAYGREHVPPLVNELPLPQEPME